MIQDKYCFFHLGNRETAQDITQEVFLKFLKSRDTYREYVLISTL
ncbi:RNA polymerase sigma factor [Mediterraneibacter gnavus]